jgi:hypothetical protein
VNAPPLLAQNLCQGAMPGRCYNALAAQHLCSAVTIYKMAQTIKGTEIMVPVDIHGLSDEATLNPTNFEVECEPASEAGQTETAQPEPAPEAGQTETAQTGTAQPEPAPEAAEPGTAQTETAQTGEPAALWEEQYVFGEPQSGSAAPTDAAYRAQGMAGKKAFLARRQRAIEEQGSTTLNSQTSVPQAWQILRNRKTTQTVEDMLVRDEEEAPMPNFGNPSKFAQFDRDFVDEVDFTNNNTQDILKLLKAANKMLARAREEGVKQEKLREKANWDRKMAQNKISRLQSFTKHVLHQTGITVEEADWELHNLKRRHKQLEAKKRTLDKEVELHYSSKVEFEKKRGELKAEFAAHRLGIEKLRVEVAGGHDEVLLAMRDIESDVRKRFEHEVKAKIMTGIAEDEIERLDEWAKKNASLNKERRQLDIERDQSRQKINEAISKEIKNDFYARGFHAGTEVGRKMKALEHYNIGFQYGKTNATSTKLKERLEAAYEKGKQDEHRAYREKTHPAILQLFNEKLDIAVQATRVRTRNSVLQEVSHEFADFVNRHDRRVKEVSIAWATWKAVVTRARCVANEPGAEAEERRQAEHVARIFAEEFLQQTLSHTWDKSPWRALTRGDSPLYMHSEAMMKTTFYKVFVSSVKPATNIGIKQLHEAQAAVKAKQQERAAQLAAQHAAEDAHLAAQHAAEDAHLAARAPTEAEFEEMKNGAVGASLRSSLPLIIPEEESEDAVAFSADELPPSWWKPQANPFTR